MGVMRSGVIGAALGVIGGAACADAGPQDQTCRLLAVLGGNQADQIAPMMTDLAGRWVEASRTGAIKSLNAILTQSSFAGGSAYRIAKLGDDIEEHLVLLRLKDGEVAGVRLLYEWTPEGLRLTTLDFKRKFSELIVSQFAQVPEPIACP